jgi:hypothetical protein
MDLSLPTFLAASAKAALRLSSFVPKVVMMSPLLLIAPLNAGSKERSPFVQRTIGAAGDFDEGQTVTLKTLGCAPRCAVQDLGTEIFVKE